MKQLDNWRRANPDYITSAYTSREYQDIYVATHAIGKNTTDCLNKIIIRIAQRAAIPKNKKQLSDIGYCANSNIV
jgi:hypothetical protein